MEISRESRCEFLRNVKVALELLLQDYELMEEGFQFFEVVDFAAIYSYIYKESSPPFIRIVGEPEERTFARSQLALETMFSIYPRPLLLIPPYHAELTNHLRSVSTIARLGALDVRVLYREKLARLIDRSEQFQAFMKLKSEAASKPIDQQLQQAALKVAKEYFPELYATLSLLESRGRDGFAALFRNDIVKLADDVLPECRSIDYATDRTDEWYRKINSSRNGKRALQSHTDAMACTYIETANALLNPQRKVVVFVSPSASVSGVLSDSLFISIGAHRKMSVTRDLTYCMLASLHKGDKAMVKDGLALVARLLELYESFIPMEWYVDKRRDLERRREQAAQDWRRCENLLIASESSITAVKPQKKLPDRDSAFLDVLKELQLAATEGRDSLSLQINRELSALNEKMGELNKLIPALPIEKTKRMYQSIQVNPANKRGYSIVFPGLADELPLELSFTDKSMIRLARAFQRLKKGGYPDQDVLSMREEILDSAGRQNTSAEHHLLAGYILAMEGRYAAALGELAAGEEKANPSQQLELNLVSAIVHRKMGDGKEAVRLLEQGLTLAESEPRVHVEMALALTLMWRQETNDRNGAKDLDRAVFHLQEAIRSTGVPLNKQARAQIENVAAFICTEKARAERSTRSSFLETAKNHIKKLESLLPEESWIGRFFDTRGYLYFAQSETAADTREQQRLLDAALEDMKRSVESGEKVALGSNIRQEHLELVLQAIARLDVSLIAVDQTA